MSRKLAVIELAKLDKVPTKRLLARLQRLRECEESFGKSDRDATERTPKGFIEFKDSPEWKAEYQYLKNLLANRENV